MGAECCGVINSKAYETNTQLMRCRDNKSIQIFDTLTKKYEECSILSIISDFQGCSQIQIEHTIFICGTPKPKNDYDSSYMYSINTKEVPLKTKLEVNSSSSHYYPTLAQYNNEYIFVLGGKRTKKCELYFINYKRWKKIPSLPQERYGAVALMHLSSYSIYLFGGIDSSTEQFITSIIQISLPSFFKWEQIYIKENEGLIKRAFSLGCAIQGNNDKFYILGGKNNQEECCDEIIILEFIKYNLVIKQSKISLPNKATFRHFQNSYFSLEDKYIYYFDCDKSIIELNLITGDCKPIDCSGYGDHVIETI